MGKRREQQGREDGRVARRAAKEARRLASLTTAAERTEDERAYALFNRVAEAQALASVDDPPRSVARALAPRDPTEVLKKAPLDRRALLIANAKSGPKSDSLLKVREIADLLAAHGIGVDVRVKLRKSVARRDARAAARQGYRFVIAAGGDGTVAAVARGLIGTQATLGIIPLGTYNNTATSLGIPTDVREACALIAGGVTRQVDIGEVQATGSKKRVPFFEIGAVGLAAALAPVGQHLEKGRWQQARATLPAALAMQPTQATVRLDGDGPARRARTLLIVVANGPRAGAGLSLAPAARMDDGLLDVQVYEDLDQAALAARFVALQATTQPLADQADRAHARRVRVETLSPLPVVADSKVVGITPAEFRVRPGALRVIVGNGPGLGRPVPDALMAATAAAAHALRLPASDPAPAAAAPPDENPAVRVLAELVPAVSRAVEGADETRTRLLPFAAAAAGGVLLGPALRAVARRLGL